LRGGKKLHVFFISDKKNLLKNQLHVLAVFTLLKNSLAARWITV